jgi:endonuclease III
MIDPTNVTKYNRTQEELEEFLLFSIFVIGKLAMRQAQILEVFIQSLPGIGTPFDKIGALINNSNTPLIHYLKNSKVGQYSRIERSITESVRNLKGKLDTCSISDLEAIYGIGSKTARLFILHSRPNQRIAVLDTHALKYLRNHNILNVPKTTGMSKSEYARLEQQFLNLYDNSGYTNVADFDLMIWRHFSGN